MMRLRAMAFRAWLFTLVAVLVMPLFASQKGKPARGARVAVVAIHDSRLLTLCPLFGKNVVASGSSPSAAEGKVTVGPAFEGMQTFKFHIEHQSAAPVILPVPAANSGGAAVLPVVPGGLDLERLAPDVDVRSRVEQQFRKLRRYTVVESPADADFVFLVESQYVTVYYSPGKLHQVRPRSDSGRNTSERIFTETESEWTKLRRREDEFVSAPRPELGAARSFVQMVGGGDGSPPNWRQSALAIAVPAAVYRQHQGNGAALTVVRLWEGISAAQLDSGPYDPTVKEASPEALVDQFHGNGFWLPADLPVCAATAGTIRTIGDGVASASDRPREAPSLTDPSPGRGAGPGHFRSNITLVTVPVTVTDSDGRSAADLPSSAFHVFEDGIEQKLNRVEPGTSPSHVALLVDTSSGMRVTSEGIRATALSIVAALRPTDRAMVVSFDNRIRVRSEFTADRTALQRAIAQLQPAGGTRLYDALALAVLDRLNAVESRKVIVLFTDGVDTGSQLTDAAGALAAIDTSNVGVYVIRYATHEATAGAPTTAGGVQRPRPTPDDVQKNAQALATADEFLGRLAAGSGGRVYEARTGADGREMLAQIAQDLSRQYLLFYYPANNRLDGTYREIRVTVDRPDQTVRARKGYRAGALQAGR